MKKVYLILWASLLSIAAFAQPANDDCANATPVPISASEQDCTAVAGNTVGGTGSSTPSFVCSGSWFGDDIWFSFTVGDDVPAGGVVVKTYFGDMAGDVEAVGMAVYPSCDMDALPYACFSNGDGTADQILVYPAALAANETYYVRVWSGVSPTDNSGTFTICAFEGEPIVEEDVIVWGNAGEGDFDGGLNGWTTNGISDSTHVWEWSSTASAFGEFTSAILNSLTSSNGAMVFNADYYNNLNGVPTGGPPYPKVTGELISPSVDLSAAQDAQVRFAQSFRGLNGNDAGTTTAGALFSFSIDGGATWSEPAPVNDDLPSNEASPNPDIRRMDMNGAAGQSDVRFKFIFDGDYYHWILDDVKVVERPANSTGIPVGGQVVAENFAMPLSQIDKMFFGSYASNLGATPQTNVTVGVTADYYDNSGTLVTDDIYAASGSLDILDVNVMDTLVLIGQMNAFEPTETGIYQVEYSLSQDDADWDDSNNIATSTFRITDKIVSKATLDADGLPVVTNSFSPADGGAFEYGIHLYFPNGKGFQADSITFGYSGGDTGLSGESVTLFLKQWIDADNDGAVVDTELEVLGFNQYNYTDEEDNQLITIPLLDFNTAEEGVALEDDTHYLLTAEYVGDNSLFLSFCEEIDYDAMIDASFERAVPVDDSNLLRYGDVLKIGDWFMRGFSTPGVPAMTTTISELMIPNEEVEVANFDLNIFPNPVKTYLTIALENLENNLNSQVTITDVSGKNVLFNRSYTPSDFPVQLNVENIPAGVYMMTLNNDNQTVTRRFVKQ